MNVLLETSPTLSSPTARTPSPSEIGDQLAVQLTKNYVTWLLPVNTYDNKSRNTQYGPWIPALRKKLVRLLLVRDDRYSFKQDLPYRRATLFDLIFNAKSVVKSQMPKGL